MIVHHGNGKKIVECPTPWTHTMVGWNVDYQCFFFFVFFPSLFFIFFFFFIFFWFLLDGINGVGSICGTKVAHNLAARYIY